MFDIGATEFLLIVIVAVIVIGPKDLPLALRTAGKWIGQMRRLSNHFRAGFDAMVREAEMQEMEKKWREQNDRIMREHPAGAPPEPEPTGALPPPPAPDPQPAASAEAAAAVAPSNAAATAPGEAQDAAAAPQPQGETRA